MNEYNIGMMILNSKDKVISNELIAVRSTRQAAWERIDGYVELNINDSKDNITLIKDDKSATVIFSDNSKVSFYIL